MEKILLDNVKRDLKSAGMSEEAIEQLLEALSIKSLAKLEARLGSEGEAVADPKQLFLLTEKFGYTE
ncbi:hypothetical protein Ancab_031848 [Ancistrocladus abbreviatus]